MFVLDATIGPTNWKAKQAICPTVVNPKGWEPNRCRSRHQQVLVSFFETCRRHTLARSNRRLQGSALRPVR